MNVAFIGLMGSGKTTAAKIMASDTENNILNNPRHVRCAFADPVKEVGVRTLQALTDVIGDERFTNKIHGQDINDLKSDPAIRGLLQFIGTELGRGYFSDTIWIDYMAKRVQEANAQDTFVVVDDCRFPNEAEALKKLGFFIVRVTRPEPQRIAYLKSNIYKGQWQLQPHADDPDWLSIAKEAETKRLLDRILNHPSETEMKNIFTDCSVHCQTYEQLKGAAYAAKGNEESFLRWLDAHMQRSHKIDSHG